jgi:hypothetical protein
MISCEPSRKLTTTALRQQVELVKQHGPEIRYLRIKCPKATASESQKEQIKSDHHIPYSMTPQWAWDFITKKNGVNMQFSPRASGGLFGWSTGYSCKYDYEATFYEKKEEAGEIPPYGTEAKKILIPSYRGEEPSRPRAIQVYVPDDYLVWDARNQSQYWMSNVVDLIVLRSVIWHEIMEVAGIYMQVFLHHYPGEFKYMINPNNYIHDQVIRQERSNLVMGFYPWSGDPPFNWVEKTARQYEYFAQHFEHAAGLAEGVDSWSVAAVNWGKAQKWWNRAAESWQSVGGTSETRTIDGEVFPLSMRDNPYWQEKMERCQDNAEEAEKRRKAAVGETQQGATKPVPFWNVAGSGGEKITIHYSDWPNGFRAKILDYKERKVTEVSGTPGTKEGKVEWGKDADPGTYYVKVNVSGERSEKVIITKKLEWSACVKFGTNGPYISITPKIGTKWPKGKGFGFSIHNFSGSTNKIGFVNVQDSNQTGEVTWGKESSQKFPKWGKYTIWAYAKDPWLQKMFNNRNLCPNWRTDVEIPVPSFKVNGAKASVAVAAKGPLIAPDTEQSLSIEYDNWPGKFKAKIRKKSSTQELVKLEGTSSTRGSFTRKVTLPTRAYYIEARPYGDASLPLAIELTAANP